MKIVGVPPNTTKAKRKLFFLICFSLYLLANAHAPVLFVPVSCSMCLNTKKKKNPTLLDLSGFVGIIYMLVRNSKRIISQGAIDATRQKKPQKTTKTYNLSLLLGSCTAT